jgi:DNA-binding HxlR family transcriptional regulator
LNLASEKKVKSPKRDDEAAAKNDEKSERLAELLKLISDDKSLLIFNTIFLASGDSSEILRTQLKLTRKQYYSRMSRLVQAGLVKRQKRRYFVTAFGNVIYDVQKLLGNALKNYWKLQAIDSLGAAHDGNIPEAERIKIIDLMIGNQQIKEILLSKNS